MARKTFSQEMQEVKNDILLLGSMVEEAVMESARALKDNNLEISHHIIQNDKLIDRKRYEIEITIIVVMATQQPTAGDLRTLAASMDICTELERIADYAKGIANINVRSGGLSLPKILSDIYSMAEKGVDMLHRAMTTYAENDLNSAKKIILEDDVIDACYTKLYYDAVNNVLGDARHIERTNYVIWAAHNLERLGDRVTNICERVIYIATGERPTEIFPTTGELTLASHGN